MYFRALVFVLALLSGDAFALEVEEQYLKKINFLCGTSISFQYDKASLKKNNLDIKRTQTKGANECLEPLRYVWYICKTGAKGSVKKIRSISCQGTPDKVGRVSFSSGNLVTTRAYEERDDYKRQKKEFEKVTGLKVPKLASEDPYHDREWSDLRWKENPVTSMQNYCLVDGVKKKFDTNQDYEDTYKRSKKSGKVQCWIGGKKTTDLLIKSGKLNGKKTYYWFSDYKNLTPESYRTTSYKDDIRHGEERYVKDGVVEYKNFYNQNFLYLEIKYHKNKKIEYYSYRVKKERGYDQAYVRFLDSGKPSSVKCDPIAKNERFLSKICGFPKPRVVGIYRSRDKKPRTLKRFENGYLVRETPGKSSYPSRVSANYKNGKLHGLRKKYDDKGTVILREKFANGVLDGKQIVFNDKGQKTRVTHFKAGKKHGKESEFHKDGRKVIKEDQYVKDQIKKSTEYYLNGKKKKMETYVNEDFKEHVSYFDNGKVWEKGNYKVCDRNRWRTHWCQDGVFKYYFKNGKRAGESHYRNGDLHGTVKVYFRNGNLASHLEYENDNVVSSKVYDEKTGKLVEAKEFYEDGSEKLAH